MKTISKTVSDSVWGLWRLLGNSVEGSVSDAVWDSISESLGISIWKSVQSRVWDSVRGLRGSVLDDAGSPIERRTRELLHEKD